MSEFFSQYELEDAIYKCLPFGAELQIAKRLGKSPGLISQYCNPSDGRGSPIYKAAAMLAVLMDIDPEAGRAALEIFTVFVERGLPAKDSGLSIDRTRERAFKEVCEFQLSEASHQCNETVARELRESIAAQRQHLEAIEAAERKSKRELASERTQIRFGRNGK